MESSVQEKRKRPLPVRTLRPAAVALISSNSGGRDGVGFPFSQITVFPSRTTVRPGSALGK
jgi:hypothetical protein